MGNGTNDSSANPVPVSGLTGIIAINAGALFSMALKADGTTWMWGDNMYGQYGRNSVVPSNIPVQAFTGITDASSIAAGSSHAVVRKTDGSVWSTGYGFYGQLGNGFNNTYHVPVQVYGFSGRVPLSAGGHHTMAMKEDDSLWAWGLGTYGELGHGFDKSSNVPVPVSDMILHGNNPPIANAGLPPLAKVGDIITLDGSGSSDPDGDLIAYQWTLTSKPSGSMAALNGSTAIRPTLAIDKYGEYVAELVVNDGLENSAPSTVVINTLNALPVANAGSDQGARIGTVVTLDGSGSSDADGQSLTYLWEMIAAPEGSAATLSDPTVVNPSFKVDRQGEYTFSLVVSDGGLMGSLPDTVTISTTNSAPVADAGQDLAITTVGSQVKLNGAASFDPDGDAISYQWSFVSKPADSQATLSAAGTATPAFVVDKYGDYVVQLTVLDATLSATDNVIVSFNNLNPIANAGASQSVTVGHTATLDGSGSHDPNGDSLSYRWSITSAPASSTASISSPENSVTDFVPDVPGTYGIQLLVNDGLLYSVPSTTQIQATALTVDDAVPSLQGAQAIVARLEPTVFRNPSLGKALLNKLNAVIANISAGKYNAARAKLRNDLRQKTNGCRLIGKPDRNDWIKDCAGQTLFYKALDEAIASLAAAKSTR